MKSGFNSWRGHRYTLPFVFERPRHGLLAMRSLSLPSQLRRVFQIQKEECIDFGQELNGEKSIFYDYIPGVEDDAAGVIVNNALSTLLEGLASSCMCKTYSPGLNDA